MDEHWEEEVRQHGDTILIDTVYCVEWLLSHNNCHNCPSELGCGKAIAMAAIFITAIQHCKKILHSETMEEVIGELNMKTTKQNRKWGRWFLDGTPPTSLVINMGGGDYPIALDRCETIQKRVHWLIHLTQKSWMSQRDLDLLAQAFADLFGDKIPDTHIELIEPIPLEAIEPIVTRACRKYPIVKDFIELNYPDAFKTPYRY